MGLAVLVCAPASAEFFGQQPEREAPATPKAQQEATGERGLPSITSVAPENRAEQAAQRAYRAAPQNVAAAKDAKDSVGAYVETVTGAPLEVFGKNLFSNVPTTFAPFDTAQVNGDYVIGTGDELQIRGWGMVNVDVTASVDRSGAIYIPRVGSVKVAGVKADG